MRPAWTSHVYPTKVMQRAVQTAGRQGGKTLTSAGMIAGKFGRADWGREMGGLHKERWAAWEGLSAIERLGDLVDD
jgi:hypothetical protein